MSEINWRIPADAEEWECDWESAKREVTLSREIRYIFIPSMFDGPGSWYDSRQGTWPNHRQRDDGARCGAQEPWVQWN